MKATHLFQEDLYPPVPSGNSSINSIDWFGGKNAKANLISLRPTGK
jgi:hypothetical protein